MNSIHLMREQPFSTEHKLRLTGRKLQMALGYKWDYLFPVLRSW
jgi:hypothetical protein